MATAYSKSGEMSSVLDCTEMKEEDAMTITIIFSCPMPDCLDDNVEIEATFQARDLIELDGCPHCAHYLSADRSQYFSRAALVKLDKAVDRALAEAGRQALEAADESRIAAWESKEER